MIDNDLFGLCEEYVRLFLLYNELKDVQEAFPDLDLDDVFSDLDVRVRVLVDDIGLGVFRVCNLDKYFGSVDGIDRFNYSFGLNDWAIVEDGGSGFKVRVHNDDVDALDTLLNEMSVNIVNLEGANHNLNRRLLHFNKVLNDKLSGCDDKYIYDVLKLLQKEIYI